MAYISDEIGINTDSFIEHYCLPISENSDAFIVNSAKNSVYLLRKSDQKLTQMWNLSQPQSFTSPAIYWTDHDSICCIVDHKKIFIWDLNSDSLKSARKIKLTDLVFTILLLNDGSPLVIFCNGMAVPMEEISDASSYKPPYIMSGIRERLIWTDATIMNDKIVVVQLTYIKSEKTYNLRSYTIIKGSRLATSVTCTPLAQKSSTLKSYCLNASSKFINFVTLWGNGDVYNYTLSDEKPEFLFQIPHINKATSVAVDIVGVTHLAVVKYKDKGSLEIWDLKYHILKGSKNLTHNLAKNLQVKTLTSSIFISSINGLLMLPVTLEPSTLSSAIGKSTSIQKSNTKNTFMWSSDLEDENMNVDLENESSMPSVEKLFDDILEQSASGDFTECSKFLEKFNNISEEQMIRLLKVLISTEDSSSKDLLLNQVFCLPFSDIFLRQKLRELSFNETLVILQKLLEIFNNKIFRSRGIKEPSDLQVIMWIQLLMQVHFEELLLSPDEDIRSFIKQLHQSLVGKMNVYSELQEIKQLLTIVQKKKNVIPEKSSQTNYCIETLYL